MTTSRLDQITWPLERLGDAMVALGRRSGLCDSAVEIPQFPAHLVSEADEQLLSRWLDLNAQRVGMEASEAETSYGDLEGFLRGAAPALIRIPGLHGDSARVVALCGGSGGKAKVIGPDLKVHRVRLDELVTVLGAAVDEDAVGEEIETLLRDAGVPERRAAASKLAILKEQLGPQRVTGCWFLGLSPGSSFWRQAVQAGARPWLVALFGSHAVAYFLWLFSWWLVGQGALQGYFDVGWLTAWAIILLSLVPLRMLMTWAQGVLAIRGGALLKQRLLHGSLKLKQDEIRHQGVGQLLGKVIESEALESLALSGGILGVMAVLELAVALPVLVLGAAGWIHAVLLVFWVGAALAIALRFYRRRRAWTESRLHMTHDLIERMGGHRTRLAQEAGQDWHAGEDQAVERYLTASREMDRTAAKMVALVPRGWLVPGLGSMVPVFVYGSASLPALAVSLGGVLLVYRALEKFAVGLLHLASARIAWQEITDLFQAASRPEELGSSESLLLSSAPDSSRDGRKPVVIEASDLVFRYRDRGDPVLRNCSVGIAEGDRCILEGGSGGGKSTLAALLTGLRSAESGQVLLRGLDRHSLGALTWRQRVTAAPQFHENHILTSTLAFNLLMGVRWPPTMEQFEEAEGLCRELGLGDLLDRMPAGMLQMVGETGWQLSQGEKSRIYIARALLQGADLLIFDESFGALDPENLQKAMQCVLKHTPTMLVIAHP